MFFVDVLYKLTFYLLTYYISKTFTSLHVNSSVYRGKHSMEIHKQCIIIAEIHKDAFARLIHLVVTYDIQSTYTEQV